MATHSSILACRIPWTEEPGRLQSMGSQSQTRLGDSAQPHPILTFPLEGLGGKLSVILGFLRHEPPISLYGPVINVSLFQKKSRELWTQTCLKENCCVTVKAETGRTLGRRVASQPCRGQQAPSGRCSHRPQKGAACQHLGRPLRLLRNHETCPLLLKSPSFCHPFQQP